MVNKMGVGPIKDILSGEKAFYNDRNYHWNTVSEMQASTPPQETVYSCEIEKKAWRIAKHVLSVVIFPIGIARLIHSLAGKIFLPASSPQEPQKALIDRVKFAWKDFKPESEWKLKRIAIEVDGYKVDATIKKNLLAGIFHLRIYHPIRIAALSCHL